jgi:ectoine hydroxylase-related dioxygenase (phytanoyl-CoA dioxygenase family)
MLTTKQITFFQEHGYLILENFIDSEIIDGWRTQVWEHFDSSLETPETWPNDYEIQGFNFSPLFGHLPVMQEITEQLGGGQFFTGGGGSPIIKWPNPEEEWAMPKDGHIDAYGAVAGWSPFMIGATTYLYDAEPKGGAFIFWPRSHQSTHKYFRQYPEQIDGSFYDIKDWDWHVLSDLSPEGPREFIGGAGDVVLWHAFLCHTGSANVKDVPRFGLFARYSHKKREEIKYEIPEDLWKYWAI